MTKPKKPTDEQPVIEAETDVPADMQADPAPPNLERPHKGGSFIRQGNGTLTKQKKG